jgi:hypothetical protein
MPNYSNSSIYKLCCNNTEIKDIYIGSTTIFKDRKHKHKYSCNNPNDTHYNQHLYKFIRETGGWDVWCMIEIEKYKAIDKRHLETRERHYIEQLKPTLNMKIPTRTNQEYQNEHKEELSVKKREYRNNNKETIKAKHQKYYQENKEAMSAKKKDHYQSNKEAILAKNKEYRDDNKEAISEKSKQYFVDNKETILVKKKQYNAENKVDIAAQTKQYRAINKEAIATQKKIAYERNNTKYICECGSTATNNNKSHHEKTNKHFAYKLHNFIYS